ncbi:serpin B9 isoform X2 [Balaenoptera musculus]|uniref:Serpin B9 isoform X2 n=2 Tax=Balaenoptera musculus TaxID=9771 RepID=A0A8B8YZ17_BALMU|nr:serpin B9 isoform X2 [Balaenoptera musculus]
MGSGAWVTGECVGLPNVQAFLPRLKLEESYALESFLCSSRMTGVFEKAKADFPGMFTTKHGPRLHTALGEASKEGSAQHRCRASFSPSGAAKPAAFPSAAGSLLQKEVLSLNTEKDIHEDFRALLTELNKPGTQYLLRTANRLFGAKTCEFLSVKFQSCCRVTQLMRRPGWFSSTQSTSKKEQRPVQMMFQEGTFRLAHIEEVQAQVLELPYAGEELSMVILLPDDHVALSSVEKHLTFEKFLAWTHPDCMKSTEVEVFLPRFKLEEAYDLGSVLQGLGVVDAFQQGRADFSAMSADSDLCLSRFAHKSLVEVNEEGTEAAAALAVTVVECCLESGPRFCADRPFLFFIRHNKASSILFCGRLSSP